MRRYAGSGYDSNGGGNEGAETQEGGGVVGGEERKGDYYDTARVFDGMGWDGRW
jgi:hypothetical protein